MKFENWISYRYLIASKGRFLTFLNVISIAGVAIGVMALIVVTGVMTGFGNNLREKILSFTPHLIIEKETGITDYEELRDSLSGIEGVIGASAYIQATGFLEDANKAEGVIVQGVDPRFEGLVTDVDKNLLEGALSDLSGDNVIIGEEMAEFYGFKLGDELIIISPGSGIAGQGWRHSLIVSGIFSSGMTELDRNLIVVHHSKAQEIFNLPENMVTGIRLKLSDPYQAEEVREVIYQSLGYSFLIRTWIDINRNLFEALFLEKWGLFIILTLMVMVASFNIVSTLVVTVTSKIHDIGILKSIGVSRGSIRNIFVKHGFYIGLLGIIWGVIGGFGISYVLTTYVKVPKQIYWIDTVPVDLQAADISIIVVAAMIISYLATIYPAAKAANLEPVDALRYE